MVGNGTRTQRITDWEDGAFLPTVAEVRRYRCAGCGVTVGRTSPEVEPGFRMSRRAADRMIGSVIDLGMGKTAAIAGLDKASVSRLVAARSQRMLDEVERPTLARIDAAEDGTICVSDARSGERTAFFSGLGDERLLPWLSSPYPSLVMPDRSVAANAIHWPGFKVALHVTTVLDMLRSVVAKAAQKAKELCAAATSAQAVDRHFARMRERLYGALECDDPVQGRGAIAKWRNACTEAWVDVFAPVIRFLSTYEGAIFSHVAAVQPMPRLKAFAYSGPAKILSLALQREHKLSITRKIEFAGPAFVPR